MIRVALKGIATRKLRSLLTALAVLLGVALISGTYILTDSIEKAFGSIAAGSYERTDAVVTGPDLHRSGASAAGIPGADGIVSVGLLRRITALPEVEEATGTLIDFSRGADPATLIDASGKPIKRRGPTYAFGIEPDAERFNPLELVDGRWAAGGGEVVIDAETASRHGYSIGDRIGVTTLGPVERFTIVGIAEFRDVATLGGAAIALFDVETAQRLHGKDGFYTIAVAAKDGVSTAELVAAIRPLLPSGAEVRSGDSQAAKDVEAASFVKSIRYLLLAFGAIALLVGAFVIVNTLSITVAQRTRELATLRMIGASRRQVRRSVVLEGVVLGLVASIVGLASGLLFAEGLSGAFTVLGLELPEAEPVFSARTAVVSLAAGIGVTTLASLIPAIRATRVAPLAAVRESEGAAGRFPSRRRAAVAVAFLVAGGAAVAFAVSSDGVPANPRVLLSIIGGMAAFVGTMLIASHLTRPLVALLGRPLAPFAGAAAKLARDNAVRNPSRTAATATALMIGIALATFAGVLGKSVLASVEAAIREQIRGDYIVESTGWQTDANEIEDALASAPGVTAATTVESARGGAVLANYGMVGVSGVDPESFGDLYRFAWRNGSDAALARMGADGAVVEATLADSAGIRVGDPVVLRTRGGRKVEATVRGIFSPPRFGSLLTQVLLSDELFARSFRPGANTLTLVRADEKRAIQRALGRLPDVAVRTPAEVAEKQNRELVSVLRLLYVLLALAVLVGLLGMVNTLVLSVFERTREIGMLRAIGMTRQQVRRMIRHESVLTALLGAALGIPLGIGVAAAVVSAIGDGLTFSLPVGTAAALIGITVLIGTVAATLPARRASRLDALEALQYE